MEKGWRGGGKEKVAGGRREGEGKREKEEGVREKTQLPYHFFRQV